MANSILWTILQATPDTFEFIGLLGTFLCDLLEIFDKFASNPLAPQSTWKFENDLETCGRENLRKLVEYQYNRIEPAEFADAPVRMTLGGEQYKRRDKSPNKIATLFGTIDVRRYLYEPLERGEKSIFPLEMQLGVEAGLATPALAERIGSISADMTQQQTLGWLGQQHGVPWSATSLRKLQSSLSSGLCAFRESAQVEKILELLKKAKKSKGSHDPVLAVGRDGVFLPMRHGIYQEGSAATVSVYDRRGKRLGTVYLGRMPESGQGTMTDQLTSLLNEVLKQWRGCPLRLVYITDCGNHPKQYYEEVLKKMPDPQRPGQLLQWQWIVDFWHACNYLAKLREVLFGDNQAGWKWFTRMRDWLRRRKQGVIEVLRSASQHWNRCENHTVERTKLFEEAYYFLRRYARHMNYSRYRRQGKPIGSGVTEAACKTVFTQRLKQSGMSWENTGGQVIVDLRVLKLSGIWSEAYGLYQQARTMPTPVPATRYQRRHRQNLKIAA